MNATRMMKRVVPFTAIVMALGFIQPLRAVAPAEYPRAMAAAPDAGPHAGVSMRSSAPMILNEYNAVRSDRWLDVDGPGGSTASDVFFGRVVGNGGNWFELVVIQDHLDARNWQLQWSEPTSTPPGGTLTLTNHALWSDLRAGTIITFSESDSAHGGLDTDTSFDPVLGDWWIHINTVTGNPNDSVNRIPQTTYVTTVVSPPAGTNGPGNFSVGNDDWQLTIRNASAVIQFGPCGEGTPAHAPAVNTREVFKLEADPGPAITPTSTSYNDGTSSSFGHANLWSGGSNVQDFSVLRPPATVVALVAVPSFDSGSVFEDHSVFPNLDEVNTLPASLTSFTAGQVFYVEVWAQTLHPTGLTMISADVAYSPSLTVVGGGGFPASGIFHTTLFNTLPSGTADNPNHWINDLSGSYLPGVGCSTDPTGNAPRWSRVAVVKVQAGTAGSHSIIPGPTGSTSFVVAHCGTPEIDPAEVTYRGINEPQGRLILVPDPAPQVTQVGGSAVTVRLNVADLNVAINGVQALIHYNTANLTLIDIVAAPPWTEVSQMDTAGDVAFAAVINAGSTGADGTVATLTFAPVAESTPIISFLGDNPPAYPTSVNRLTEAALGLPISPTRTDTTDGDIAILDGDTCLIGGTEYAEGALNPGNACEACDPAANLTDWTPIDGCEAPAAVLLAAVSRKACDLNLNISGRVQLGNVSSDPRADGISELRLAFDPAPGGPGLNPVTLQEQACGSCPCDPGSQGAYAPYSGGSVISASVQGSELVLAFTPPLENARTYKVEIGAEVTSQAGQSLEIRGLVGDVTSDARVNGADRSVVVGAWTGSGFTCSTDLNGSGTVNGNDRSVVVSAWTGPARCAP